MEKSWKDFWTTGKVEDYLTYRDRVESGSEKQSEDRKSSPAAEEQNKEKYR